MRIAHIGWNLAGLSLPLLVAAVSVPQLIDQLGKERFGLLALAWGLIGYAGALDLGVGRAITQMVAKLRGEKNEKTVPKILATASRITLVSGLIGSILIAGFAFIFEKSWLSTTEIADDEIKFAMLLMAIALPAQAMSATYRGLNEAYQNFRGINLLRIGLGIVTFGGPYLVSFYTNHLAALVSTLVVSRIFALIIYRWLAKDCLTDIGSVGVSYSKNIAKNLFKFGGWVMLSSVISPILVQADRFFIGSLISAAAVTVYVLPYELVVQSLILVGAISSVAFPSLTTTLNEKNKDWRKYFIHWLIFVSVIMFVVCLILAFALPKILSIWIGNQLDVQSVLVGQILCIGVFANSIGSMFYTLLHAQGKVYLTAKLHLIELPLFLIALYPLVSLYGVIGAAIAWVGRMVFDAILLAWLSRY